MAGNRYSIEEFLDPPGVREIIGVGGVRKPFGEAQEVEVRVLTALRLEEPDFDPDADVHIDWLGCGQLDLLEPGSLWQDGKKVGHSDAQELSGQFAFAGTEGLGHGPGEGQGQRLFPSALIAHTPGFLLRRTGTKEGGQPRYILVPQLELIRLLFGVSAAFLLQLFDGLRSPAASFDRGLVDRSRCEGSPDGKTFKLRAHRALTRSEALMMAYMLSNSKVRQLHDSVFQQLSVSSEWKAEHPKDLNLDWPWDRPISLKAVGQWVNREEGNRFIVRRLVDIDLKPSFKRIEVSYPSSAETNRQGLPPIIGRTRVNNADTLLLQTGRAPSPFRRPSEIKSSPVTFGGAENVEIILLPLGGEPLGPRWFVEEDLRDALEVSTADRDAGADRDVGKVRVTRSSNGPVAAKSRSFAEALRLTCFALEKACLAAGWTLKGMPQSKIEGGGKFHEAFDFSREYLVAILSAQGTRLVVIDRGSPAGDERSLGILIPLDGGCSDADLASAARRLCSTYDGRWRSKGLKSRKFRVEAANRSAECWDNPETYASMLRSRIASIIGRV